MIIGGFAFGDIDLLRIRLETLVVSFSIGGSLRFLSHRQTVTMLERALIRGGVELGYSEGFNPHPRMSLPLPRTVGIATEKDILTASILSGEGCDSVMLKDSISGQVPEGCQINDVFLCPGKTSFKAQSVLYEFGLGESVCVGRFQKARESLCENLRTGIAIMVERKGSKRKRARTVNVGAFIESVELDEKTLRVRCSVTEKGSIRPGELLELLGLEAGMLSGGIVRKDVKWDNKTNIQ
jgi:radical SAM-linked protein